MGNNAYRNKPCSCGSNKKYKKCCLLLGRDFSPNEERKKTPDFQYEKSSGFNDSEEILAQLGEKSFLSLWSYPNVHHKPGEELCDLLVVSGNKLIIFSDKYAKLKLESITRVDWDRWYKKAIKKSIKQVIGARRVLQKKPALYLDGACKNPLPIDLPEVEDMEIHLICVANGANDACKEFHGDTRGSLTISSQEVPVPFSVKSIHDDDFIHFFDELSIKAVLTELDTVSDFVSYLNEKELFMRQVEIMAGGEEDLLAIYLESFNDEENKHDFSNATQGKELDAMYIDEGSWEGYLEHPQTTAKKQADEVSYFWDYLISRFAHHSLTNTQYLANPHGVKGTELAVRMMALENRFSRRILAKSFLDIIMQTNTPGVRRRFTISPMFPERGYAFLAMKKPVDISEDEYRKRRTDTLYAMCLIFKHRNPDLKVITGLATETHGSVGAGGFSEDIVHMEIDALSEQQKEDAEYLSEELGILKAGSIDWKVVSENEYPEV